MSVTNWHLYVHKGKDNTMFQLLKGLSISYMMKKIQTRSFLVGWHSACSSFNYSSPCSFPEYICITYAADLSQREMVQGYLDHQGSRRERKH